MTKAKRGRRKPLARGIYQDKYGIGIPIDGKEHRFPRGTPLEELRRFKRESMQARPPKRVRTHTLDAYFHEYLKTIPDEPRPQRDGTIKEGYRRRNERALWRHWQLAGFGGRAPGAITSVDVRQQLAAWESVGAKGRAIAPATRKHLRRLLGAVYRTANGKAGYNPVREVRTVTLRYEEPRAIPYAIVDLILQQMPDKVAGHVNRAKLRLRVQAYTGLPPAQVARLKPRDLDLEDRAVLARPRRKGEGVAAIRLPLIEEGVEALRAFAAADAFGPFNSRNLARTWRLAVTKARQQWEAARAQGLHTHRWPLPEDVRAYDLRHSFGTELMLTTGNLKVVADMLMHATLTTTARYTLAAVARHLRDAADAIHLDRAGSIVGSTEDGSRWPQLAAVVQSGDATGASRLPRKPRRKR